MLSEVERNDFFERKKKEVLDRLLGPAQPYKDKDPITVRYTSKNNGKLWYDEPRIIENMNLDAGSQKYLHWYNKEFRKNNGRIVTHIDKPIGEVVPPPIK